MPKRWFLYCASVVLLLASSTTTVAAAEEQQKIKVKIKKLHIDCEENDSHCEQSIFITHGDGEHGASVVHFAAGEPGAHAFAWSSLHSGKGGHLGVELTELTPELRTHFGVPEGAGVMVSKVMDDSPALTAGLQVGDIVSAVDGEDVTGAGELARAIRAHEGGDTVVLEVWRDAKLRQISATLEQTESPMKMARKMVFKCKDGEDCDFDFGSRFNFSHDFDFDFGCDGEDCEITIECRDGDCTCVVNGEDADCPDLPGLHLLHK